MVMGTRNPESSARFMGHPVHPVLVTIPVGLFIAVFIFDLAFWQSRSAVFATGSIWLLGIGLAGGVLAAIAGLIDFLGDVRIRALGDAWQHAIGNVVLVLVQLVNIFFRIRDGAEVILPWGLILSLVAVCILLFTGWKGGELVYRHRVAVADEPRAQAGTPGSGTRPPTGKGESR